jgi:hypothetical protein
MRDRLEPLHEGFELRLHGIGGENKLTGSIAAKDNRGVVNVQRGRVGNRGEEALGKGE